MEPYFSQLLGNCQLCGPRTDTKARVLGVTERGQTLNNLQGLSGNTVFLMLAL